MKICGRNGKEILDKNGPLEKFYMNKYEKVLVEKIVRAKVILEGLKVKHGDRCIVELDPEGLAPCDCGASQRNGVLDKAIEILSL